jgi:hypothetical protein
VPAYIDELAARLQAILGERVRTYPSLSHEVSIEVDEANLLEVARTLRDDPQLWPGSTTWTSGALSGEPVPPPAAASVAG